VARFNSIHPKVIANYKKKVRAATVALTVATLFWFTVEESVTPDRLMRVQTERINRFRMKEVSMKLSSEIGTLPSQVDQ